MAVLLCTENISGTSDFKVTHRDMEARTELGIFTNCRQSLCGNLRQLLAASEREISACTS